MSDQTTKLTKIQIIEAFFKERGEPWDLAKYQIVVGDASDRKVEFVKVTNSCSCEDSKKKRGSIVKPGVKTLSGTDISDVKLNEVITINVEKDKKTKKDVFTLSVEQPVCMYTETAYTIVSTTVYDPAPSGKLFPTARTETEKQYAPENKNVQCKSSATISPSTTSGNPITYGVILAALGEQGLPEEFTIEHKILIDSLKTLLDSAGN